jgi:hypothetical protein
MARSLPECLNGIYKEWLNFNWPPRRARALCVKMIIVVVVVVPLALDYAHQSHTPALAAATRRRHLHFTFYTLLARHPMLKIQIEVKKD